MSGDETVRMMQQCQLRMLLELERVCIDNKINYYLAFGTCLGAIRHQGFIPWDDDIDIFMRIGDLDKLVEVQEQLPSHLFLQTHEKEPEFGLPIARIRDSSTTLIEADHCDRDINHGVYIDIYPLFYCKENAFGMKVSIVESFICRLFTYNAPPSNKGFLSKLISCLLLHLVPNSIKDVIARYLYKKITSQEKTKYVSNFPDISQGKRYLDEWFYEPVLAEFEGYELPLPSKPEDFLAYYFHDYMQLPPENERKVHHNYLFADFNNSYLKYKGIEYCKNS